MRSAGKSCLIFVFRCLLFAFGSAAVSTAVLAQTQRLCGAVQDPSGAMVAAPGWS